VPIKASAGHWPPTTWFLQFAKQRSVWTHTLGAEPLSLSEPWLALKGAGHFETACRPCHGAPDLAQPRVARAMTPPPPDLSARVRAFRPEELFYIVKHGIKFTGMPAWPSLHRDDEVRAMVAFLRELPRLDAAGYQRLVHGDAVEGASTAPIADLAADSAPPARVLTTCLRCHGRDGRGREQAASPRLAGQQQGYLLAALAAYARDERASGIMQPIAAGLSPEEMAGLARYYAALPRTTGGSAPAPAAERERAGAAIATRGLPAQGVPACRHCHGPGAAPRNSAYPELAGQFADYLVLQLELLKTGRRGGSPYAHVMARVAGRLTPAQMRDAAAYYASLESSGR
jgi:cytochrome c553